MAKFRLKYTRSQPAQADGCDMDMRELRALEIAARSKITWDGDGWNVPSQSGSGKYRVRLLPVPVCTCDDFALRQQPCKHVLAVRLVQERDHGGQPPVIVADAVPKKPTYRQDWPKYNLAQTTEKNRFQVLLHGLCRGVEELPRSKMGRHAHLTCDSVFAMAFKVYSTVSTRRFACDPQRRPREGLLVQADPGVEGAAIHGE